VVDPPDRLRAVAQELGEKIANHTPEHLATTKQALWRALEVMGQP
jgi:enoyl-CoA hydratase/carnithine racemase